jgi:prolyl oligopeptidase
VHDLKTGALLYQIPIGIGSIGGVYCRKSESRIFFSFESFLVPTVVYQGDFAKCPTKESPIALSELRRVQVKGIDPNQFEVKQEFFASKDGTKVHF